MGILSNIKKAISGGDTEETKPAEVAPREMPESFYIDTIEAERAQKETFFRSSPYSPIEDKINFKGLDYFPPNPAFRYTLTLNRADSPELLTFQTSTGDEQEYQRLGTVEFEVEGQAAQLAVYKAEEHEGLFLPFRDATSGTETYGAGRYLEPEILSSGVIVVDFNLCYNPFCAYSEVYSCPLPPFENHLTRIAIRAGEKRYTK